VQRQGRQRNIFTQDAISQFCAVQKKSVDERARPSYLGLMLQRTMTNAMHSGTCLRPHFGSQETLIQESKDGDQEEDRCR